MKTFLKKDEWKKIVSITSLDVEHLVSVITDGDGKMDLHFAQRDIRKILKLSEKEKS